MGKSFLHSNLDFFSTYLVFFSFLGDVQHYSYSACPVPSGDVSPSCVNSSASCSCRSSYTSAHLSRDTTAKVRCNLPIYRTLIRTYSSVRKPQECNFCVCIVAKSFRDLLEDIFQGLFLWCLWNYNGIDRGNGQPSADSLIDLLRMAEGYRHI